MPDLPQELIAAIISAIQEQYPWSSFRLAPLACINTVWQAAVESILWENLIITVYSHRRGHDLKDLRRFTSGPSRQHRRGAIKSLTMRWVKYTLNEENKDLRRIKRTGVEPDERLPIPRRMSQEDLEEMDLSDDQNGDEAETRTAFDDESRTEDDDEIVRAHETSVLDDSDAEEPDDVCKDNVCEQLHSAQTSLFENIRIVWDYIASWQTDLSLKVFRVRLVCTNFAHDVNDILQHDKERYLAFLRKDLPPDFKLPQIDSLRLVDVDGTRNLASWTNVVGMRILLATPTIVPKLYGGGAPLRILPTLSRPSKAIVSDLMAKLPNTEVSSRWSWEDIPWEF